MLTTADRAGKRYNKNRSLDLISQQLLVTWTSIIFFCKTILTQTQQLKTTHFFLISQILWVGNLCMTFPGSLLHVII